MHNGTVALTIRQVTPLSDSLGGIGATAKKAFETPLERIMHHLLISVRVR
jgi:hypothetical protein